MAEQLQDNERVKDDPSCDMPEFIEKIYSSHEYADSERPSVINLIFANPGPSELEEKADMSRVTFPWLLGTMTEADKKDAQILVAASDLSAMVPLSVFDEKDLPEIDKPINTDLPVNPFPVNIFDSNPQDGKMEIQRLSDSANTPSSEREAVRYIFDPVTGQRRRA